ncbi:class I SAM-dependent methyltransferase [Comamonas sp. JUb58]|uniref:SAM-dependent methyltransferase n=1 Tax=Comamonas sp. JUb58 TaxID=2485114 RepID=UPI00105C2E6C|nr:class I SAM-dependent methyltransferase [Comamonas sp. JUb58]TDS83114.1 methyltransferase family protein [Comamonas sp. JUb58]
MTTSSEHPLIDEAMQLLADGNRAGASELLLRARADKATLLQAHALIEQYGLDGCFSNIFGLDCSISDKDDIFGFFCGHPSSNNPLRDYLADGWRTLAELMTLLESVGKPLMGTRNFLEFASGHGRFTRHLAKALGPERVTVSDVVADGVAFAKATFGVQGFASVSKPEDLQAPRQYDVVFVLSLFTHLPRATWNTWLKALYDLVEPGGVLVFTTHGAKATAYDRVVLDDEGFFFTPFSESNAIDFQEYGLTFTSEQFVREQIDAVMGLDKLLRFSPVHFWNHQDAFVLQRPL